MRPKLTYANVVSTLCLFILLGGGAYAAVKLPKNSVGTKQLKKGAVKADDLGENAVSSPKVANGSLLKEDFAADQLPPGPQGEQGERGLRGASGASGIANFYREGQVKETLPTGPKYVFLGPPALDIAVTAGQRLYVTGVAALGSGVAGGANDLSLHVCSQMVGAEFPTPLDAGILNLTVPQGQIHTFSINWTGTLPPGTYDVGTCGQTDSPNWNQNDFGHNSILRLDP
jgi:hypothetical protein